MNQLIQAIRSEQLKQKRTLALRLAFIAPLAIIVLQFYLLYQNGLTYLEGDQSPWVYWTRQTLQFWALLMAPLFITLETALVAQLDHKQQCWKQLFVLPISRWAIYGAKIIASLAFLALSTLTLLAGILVGGAVFALLKPDLGFSASIPWGDVLSLLGIAYIGSFLIIVLHSWIALYWSNFVIAVGIGIVMTVAGIFVINSDLANYYPWALSALAVNNFANGQSVLMPLLLSVLAGVVILLVGGWLFLRRDVL